MHCLNTRFFLFQFHGFKALKEIISIDIITWNVLPQDSHSKVLAVLTWIERDCASRGYFSWKNSFHKSHTQIALIFSWSVLMWVFKSPLSKNIFPHESHSQVLFIQELLSYAFSNHLFPQICCHISHKWTIWYFHELFWHGFSKFPSGHNFCHKIHIY